MPIPPSFPFALDLKDGFVQVDSCQNGKIYYNEKTGICKKFGWSPSGNTTPLHTFQYFDSLSMERWHRDDGPAIVQIVSSTGFPKSLKWYSHGVAHRDENEGPQTIEYGFDIVILEIYSKNGVVHRDADKPSCIQYGLNHQKRDIGDGNYKVQIIEEEHWYKDGKIHRDVGPATIKYSSESIVCEYYKSGARHRLDGPAMYVIRGSKMDDTRLWFVNGMGVDIKRYPVIHEGRICNRIKLDKAALIDAAMFDREYGKFLLDFSHRYDPPTSCYMIPM